MLDRDAEAGGFVLFEELEIVEAAEEEEVGDLLDDFKRVGDAALTIVPPVVAYRARRKAPSCAEVSFFPFYRSNMTVAMLS